MENVPPYQVKRLPLSFGYTMVRLAQVVQRQHSVFGLNVAQDDFPIVVVIQFGGQYVVRENKMFLFAVAYVGNRKIRTPYLVAIVDKSGQYPFVAFP